MSVEEFTGRYSPLQLGKVGKWYRAGQALDKEYNVVRHKKNKKITHIELQGYQNRDEKRG